MIAVQVRRIPAVPDRQCEAKGCAFSIASEHAMCRRHWRMVPRRLKGRIEDARAARDWRTYRAGVDIAVNTVADIEQGRLPAAAAHAKRRASR